MTCSVGEPHSPHLPRAEGSPWVWIHSKEGGVPGDCKCQGRELLGACETLATPAFPKVALFFWFLLKYSVFSSHLSRFGHRVMPCVHHRVIQSVLPPRTLCSPGRCPCSPSGKHCPLYSPHTFYFLRIIFLIEPKFTSNSPFLTAQCRGLRACTVLCLQVRLVPGHPPSPEGHPVPTSRHPHPISNSVSGWICCCHPNMVLLRAGAEDVGGEGWPRSSCNPSKCKWKDLCS